MGFMEIDQKVDKNPYTFMVPVNLNPVNMLSNFVMAPHRSIIQTMLPGRALFEPHVSCGSSLAKFVMGGGLRKP